MKSLFLPLTRIRVAFRRRLIACLAIGFVGVSSLLHAQSLSGITGTVTDQAGLAVEEAEVTATNDATGVVRSTTTSSAGVYSITDLIPGTYTVRFSKAGFQPTVHSGVRTEVSRRVSVDARLQAGGVQETIEVTAPAISLETSQPEVGWTLEKKVLEELPLNLDTVGDRGRQIDAMLTLVPGVTGDAFSHRINGGADMQNEIVFEGVPVAQSETQGFQSNINPPYEMVEEFRVVGSTFSTQYGLGMGAVTYKFASGTNEFHGTGFEILRNEALNAVGHAPIEAGKKDKDRRHNFGGSLSGPIIIPGLYNGRDKTFFHATAEWFRLNQPVSGRISVPTAAMKRGDFSAFPQPIFVPDRRFLVPGCTPGAPSGQQFPGNRIPENCFSTISRGVLGLIPDPTGGGFDRNASSQITNQPTRQTNWGFSLDHRLTAGQSLHFSFWRNSWNQPYCCDNDAFYTNELTGLKDEPRIGKGLFATYSNIFSNRLVMTAGFGYLREMNNEFNLFLGTAFPGAANSESFPAVGWTGNYSPTGWGAADGETASLNNKLGLSFANNWLYTTGRHTLNWGFEARRSSQTSQECRGCSGRFGFSSNSTADANDLDNTGSAFASFLLGIVDTASRGFTPLKYFTNFYVAPYIQDDFKLNSNLTISAGLRWDIMRPFLERDDQFVFMDPTRPNPGAIDPRTGQPLLGAITKLGDCAGCTGFRRAPINWTQFSPRLGMVYKLNDKTVLSTGVAVTHLNGGTFEFGTNKAANDYSGLLAGTYSSPDGNQTIPGYGQWEGNLLPAPSAPPFGPTIANGQGVKTFSNDGRSPYSTAWTAGIQRELPWSLLFAATYVGNRTIHLPSYANPENQLDPKFLDLCSTPSGCVLERPWTSPEAQAVLQNLGYAQCNGFFTPYCDFINDKGSSTGLVNALRPFPQYLGSRNNFETNGTSFYNAIQASLQRRFQGGLGFLLAYTLSRSMQSGDDSGFSTFNGQALNKFNPRAEWTVGDNDKRHSVVISGVYELPIRPQGALAKNIVGGWQLSGTLFYDSGSPKDLGASGSPLLSGNRPNYDPNVPLDLNWGNATDGYRSQKDKDGNFFFPAPLPSDATPFDVFNIAAFSSPGRSRLGNAPRRINGLTRGWRAVENLALSKRLYAGNRVSAQLRIEFFNVFNRTGTCDVNTNVDDRDHFALSNASRIRDGQDRVIGVHFDPCQERTPRRGQVFMKIDF
jgi:hypothetical protein